MHKSELDEEYQPSEGDEVEFDVEETPKGKSATNVKRC